MELADWIASPSNPGHPEQSEVLSRLITTDEDDLMPPAKTKKKLTQKQIALVKQWIAEGAEYEVLGRIETGPGSDERDR